MKFFTILLSYFVVTLADFYDDQEYRYNCVSFSVGAGTGCAWLCQYCENALGTTNYYFTNDVCTYQQGQGCVGNPEQGVQYTCCSVGY